MSYITKSQDILNDWESIKHLRYTPVFHLKMQDVLEDVGDVIIEYASYEDFDSESERVDFISQLEFYHYSFYANSFGIEKVLRKIPRSWELSLSDIVEISVAQLFPPISGQVKADNVNTHNVTINYDYCSLFTSMRKKDKTKDKFMQLIKSFNRLTPRVLNFNDCDMERFDDKAANVECFIRSIFVDNYVDNMDLDLFFDVYFPDFDAKSAGDMYDKMCNYEYLQFFYDSMTR